MSGLGISRKSFYDKINQIRIDLNTFRKLEKAGRSREAE